MRWRTEETGVRTTAVAPHRGRRRRRGGLAAGAAWPGAAGTGLARPVLPGPRRWPRRSGRRCPTAGRARCAGPGAGRPPRRGREARCPRRGRGEGRARGRSAGREGSGAPRPTAPPLPAAGARAVSVAARRRRHRGRRLPPRPPAAWPAGLGRRHRRPDGRGGRRSVPTLSPAAPMAQMTVKTGTRAPSSKKVSSRTPSTGASGRNWSCPSRSRR